MAPNDEEEALEAQDSFPAEGPVPETAKDNGMRNRGKDNRLSATSQQYDLNGKGELDELQKAMRDMDSQNFGHISNEKVYKLLQDQLKTQNELLSMKRITIALAIFTLILALSNMGTAFAAARLAKDTTIDASGNLVDKNHMELPVGVRDSAMVVALGGQSDSRRLIDTTVGSGITADALIPWGVASSVVTSCDGGSAIFELDCEDGTTLKLYACPAGYDPPKYNKVQGKDTWTFPRGIFLGPCTATGKSQDCPLQIPAELVDNDSCRLKHPAVHFPSCSAQPTSRGFECSDSCKMCGCAEDTLTCGSTGACVEVGTEPTCVADAASTCDGTPDTESYICVLFEGGVRSEINTCDPCGCASDTTTCQNGETCVLDDPNSADYMKGCPVFDDFDGVAPETADPGADSTATCDGTPDTESYICVLFEDGVRSELNTCDPCGCTADTTTCQNGEECVLNDPNGADYMKGCAVIDGPGAVGTLPPL